MHLYGVEDTAAILYCRIWDARREFNILKQFKKKW